MLFKRLIHLHEYQSKQIMSKYGINTQKFKVASSAEQARQYVKELNVREIVVKAQVHAGGRGKGYFTSGLKKGVHILTE